MVLLRTRSDRDRSAVAAVHSEQAEEGDTERAALVSCGAAEIGVERAG